MLQEFPIPTISCAIYPICSLPPAPNFSLIQDVFYNDMRSPTGVDYSESILAWNKKQRERNAREGAREGEEGGGTSASKVCPPPYAKANMEGVLIGDVGFEIGAKYVYVHEVR